MSLDKIETRDEQERGGEIYAAVAVGLSPDDVALLGKRLAAEIEEIPDGETAPISVEQFEDAVSRAWNMGARFVFQAGAMGREACRICGCWELEACDKGCARAEPGLCTACAGPG